MKYITYCCLVYLLLLASPYWAGGASDVLADLAEEGRD